MAFTFQGIGTTFYGQRDFRADGSFITTEWFVFVFVPIIPFRSLRVRYQGTSGAVFYSKKSYLVCEKTFPNWKQVLCVYSFAIFTVAWIVFIFYAYTYSAKDLNYFLGLVLLYSFLGLPALIPVIFRHDAKRKLKLKQGCSPTFIVGPDGETKRHQ
jgi:hypothetical protein